MSKRSFKDIEQFIKNAAEVGEPAFDEESWNKMEALLDKEGTKKPFAFWWLLPVLIGAGIISYFALNKNEPKDEKQAITVQKNNDPVKESIKTVDVNKNLPNLRKYLPSTKLFSFPPGIKIKMQMLLCPLKQTNQL